MFAPPAVRQAVSGALPSVITRDNWPSLASRYGADVSPPDPETLLLTRELAEVGRQLVRSPVSTSTSSDGSRPHNDDAAPSTTPSAGSPDMLDPDKLDHIAAAFGVAEEQVRRDHLISHVLAALSAEADDNVVFFGGTALARSVLPDGRLSEDITLHRLRHTVATVLVERGDILQAQHRLGHRDASTTLRIYSHALPLTDSAAAATLDGVFR